MCNFENYEPTQDTFKWNCEMTKCADRIKSEIELCLKVDFGY